MNSNGTGSYDAIAHSQASTGALGVWWEKQLVFWTDLRKGTIKRARIPSMTSDLSIPHKSNCFLQCLLLATFVILMLRSMTRNVRPTFNGFLAFHIVNGDIVFGFSRC